MQVAANPQPSWGSSSDALGEHELISNSNPTAGASTRCADQLACAYSQMRNPCRVAEAAAADADELPPRVRAQIDAATEVYVDTPGLPGRLAWLASRLN
jgi:hypothetical protein